MPADDLDVFYVGPRGETYHPRSESHVLRRTIAVLEEIARSEDVPSRIRKVLRDRINDLGRLTEQVAGGYHRNARDVHIDIDAHNVRRNPLMIFGNPPAGGKLFGSDVQAVLYRHAEDGKYYCHGFGDADVDLISSGGSVTINGLLPRTGVRMSAVKDGTIVIHKRGVDLWKEF